MKKTYIILISVVCACLAVLTAKTYYNRSREAYVYLPAMMERGWKYTDLEMKDCAWCHRKLNLNRHHIIPQSADPSLKNTPTNLVVLCRDCHFILGHRANYKWFNPDVMEIVTTYTNNIKSSEYLNND